MNPIPFTIGGETTDIEDAWRALRALVGGEHGPGPEGGVEDLARQVKAERIAFAERAFERAFLQLFPGTSTDALPIWEELTLTSGADTAVALRELVERAWRARRAATTPVLAEELRAISSQLSIAIEPDAETIVTEPGKAVRRAEARRTASRRRPACPAPCCRIWPAATCCACATRSRPPRTRSLRTSRAR
jgi:hypothetical protein